MLKKVFIAQERLRRSDRPHDLDGARLCRAGVTQAFSGRKCNTGSAVSGPVGLEKSRFAGENRVGGGRR